MLVINFGSNKCHEDESKGVTKNSGPQIEISEFR
jgi:hypothetical protein